MSANPTVNVASPQAGYSNRNLRKGEVGDWRNHFSLEQNARFDALYQEKMAGTGLNLEFDLERLRKIIAYPLDADADLDAYEQAFQQLVDSAAVQSVFQRMGAVPAEITHPEQTHHNDRNTTASVWAARLTDPPPVSCICLTYGRPELLEEAIYSFLQQDYAGPKELIVLNDYAEQQLEFAHPEVRIINLPTRFRTVGEKMNAVVALASHDLLFVWDDDDIYLPHRLAFSVQHFDPHKGFFKPEHAWIWNNGVVSGPAKHLFHVGSCWSRRLFDAVRGFPAEGTGYDLLFEERLAHHFPGSAEPYAIMPEDIAYLYRWGGTGSYHMSQFGYLKLGGNVGQEEVASYVAQRAHQGEIPHGRILLQPHWKHDYQQLVADYIQSLAANQVQQLFVSTLSGAI